MNITTDPDEFHRQISYPEQPMPQPVYPGLVAVAQAPGKSNLRPARWPRWMKKRDVAEYLSISVRTLDKWLKTSLLPPAMIFGDHLKLWDRLELDKHLDRRASTAGSNQSSVSNLLSDYKSNQRGEA